jgi:hypothetical protein
MKSGFRGANFSPPRPAEAGPTFIRFSMTDYWQPVGLKTHLLRRGEVRPMGGPCYPGNAVSREAAKNAKENPGLERAYRSPNG